jgi:hypothetical protein
VSREPIDVARVIKDWLKTDLATRFPTLSVRLELPADWTLGSDPVLLVEDDGDPLVMPWPMGTSPTIRVTSWTSGRDRTYIHAALSRLLTAPIPGMTALPGTGIFEARDAKTRGDLASFTVRARARTAVPQ